MFHFEIAVFAATLTIGAAVHADSSSYQGAPLIHYISKPTKSDAQMAQEAQDQQQMLQEGQAMAQALGQMMSSQYKSGSGSSNSNEAASSNGSDSGSSSSGSSSSTGGDTSGMVTAGGGMRPIFASELSGSAPIIPVFQKWFDKCTEAVGLGRCKFINDGIMGDARHRAERSCHNTGEAIDVASMYCPNGGLIAPIAVQASQASHDKFFEVGKCLAHQTGNEMRVIYYKNDAPGVTGTNFGVAPNHETHLHVEIRGCAMVTGAQASSKRPKGGR